jgi:hypothetical protein
MKQLRTIAFIHLATVLAALAAATNASATTLEVGGVTKSGSVTIEAVSSAVVFRDTFGLTANKCESKLEGTTSVFSGTAVSGAMPTVTFTPCEREQVVFHTNGSLSVERIGTTTNGTVRWSGGVWTIPSPFGTLTCQTAASPGTDIGTLTGVSSGNATIDLFAVLMCGISVKWEGTYKTTTAIGVVA